MAIDLPTIVRYANKVGMKRFLQDCHAQLVVTGAVVNAVLANDNRDEVMCEMLCGNHRHIGIDIDAALEILKEYGFPSIGYLLSYRSGLFLRSEKIKQVLLQWGFNNHTLCRMRLYSPGSGYKQIVEYILECGVSMEMRYYIYECHWKTSGNTVSHKCHRLVENFVAHGVHLEWKGKIGDTTLMWAIRRKSLGRGILLERGDEVNMANNMGTTPLMLAVHLRYTSVMKRLLERGADVTMRDHFGLTAEDWANIRGYYEVAKLLSDYCAKGTPAESIQYPGDVQNDEDSDVE